MARFEDIDYDATNATNATVTVDGYGTDTTDGIGSDATESLLALAYAYVDAAYQLLEGDDLRRRGTSFQKALVEIAACSKD